jgi:hypothetical protein
METLIENYQFPKRQAPSTLGRMAGPTNSATNTMARTMEPDSSPTIYQKEK